MTQEEQLQIIRRGTIEIIGESEILERIKAGRILRVKLGVDPTAKDVTLGWAVVLRKLRDFQKMGHIACLIIGDFTALIGDPTGKSKTRKQLTREEVQANVEAVSKQFFRILDPAKTEIYYNKDWLGKMGFEDVIRLCSRYTVARIMERDDFTKRFTNHEPIAMHEILYPLCQGMDSVEIKSDIEIGGNDQKFNNLVGRTLMEQYGLEPQAVVLCPLLVGTDGKEKMSQSLGNYISITDDPNTMFGKTMSIPDETIANWFELCTDVPMNDVAEMMSEGKNPRDAKMRLGREIVALYHSEAEADAAVQFFVDTFSQRKVVTEADDAAIPESVVFDGLVSIPSLVVALGLAASNGKVKDLISAGAIALDGEKVTSLSIPHADLVGKILKVGKHQFRKLI
ncbi:MAG: tyrosine--tRNA ligase [Armatimonadota bacterium]